LRCFFASFFGTTYLLSFLATLAADLVTLDFTRAATILASFLIGAAVVLTDLRFFVLVRATGATVAVDELDT
jgi:hypothetical protein